MARAYSLTEHFEVQAAARDNSFVREDVNGIREAYQQLYPLVNPEKKPI